MRIQRAAVTRLRYAAGPLTTMPALPSLEGADGAQTLKLSMDPRDMMGMQMLMKKYGAQAMSGMDNDSMNAHMQGGNMGAWRDGSWQHGYSGMNHGAMGV